jgi:plastocyanin
LVSRQLTSHPRRGRGFGRYASHISAALLLALAIWPATAQALNTRVSISEFAWSVPRVQVDLNEKVTWDWIGPDLAHSVTGRSANALAWDSDPGTGSPSHRAGDAYTLQFTQPGSYLFQCKLHASVRGEVVVSALAGNPDSDPGPRPPLKLDRRPPTLGAVALRREHFRGAAGVATSLRISDRGTLDAEYYRLGSKGRRAYSGYKTWRTFIGINRIRLGARWKRFRARPGRYEVVLRVLDSAGKVSKPVSKRFEILG